MTHLKVSDKLLFDATEKDREIVDLLLQLKSPPRWPAFNAVRHMNAAWRIHELDPNMAMFHGITAEEEAATAVLQSLKRRGYPGAEKIDPRNHLHKNAVIPFFDGMTRVIASIRNTPEVRFVLDKKYRPARLILEILLPVGKNGVWVRSQPPLDIAQSRSVDGGVTHFVEDFSRGFSKAIKDSKAKTVGDYLRARANQRNRLLYATQNGYPDFKGDVPTHLRNYYQKHVFALLRMFLLIDPYPQHQDFIVQSLKGFVTIITSPSLRIRFDE